MKKGRKLDPAAIHEAFDALFDDFTDEERLEQEGRMIGFAFLSEVERVLEDRGMKRKDFAKAIGVSGSFITQLFTGEKPLSDKHKAMFQRALGIRFTITAATEADYASEPIFDFPDRRAKGILRIVRDFTPNYGKALAGQPENNENLAA